jgi:PAS domain S-box-containing protein
VEDDAIARSERVAKALGALFAETRVPVIVVRKEGEFVAANRAAIDQYGWPIEELLKMRIHDFQAGPRKLAPDLMRAYKSDPGPLERRPHHRRDGSVLWVIPAAHGFEFEGETLIVSVLKDVTAVLDAEQKARDATEASLRDRQLVLNAVVAMLGERELKSALQVLARSFAQAIGRAATVWIPERKDDRVLRPIAWHDLSDEGMRQLPTKVIDLDRERYARLAWDTGVGYAIHASETVEGTTEHATVARLGSPGVVAPLMGRDGPHGLLYGIPQPGEDLPRAVTLATTLGTFGGLVLEAVQLEARAEVMWHAASEQISDGIALLDRDQRIVRVNSAELRLLGMEEAEVVGKKCHEVFSICHGVSPCAHRVALEEKKRFVREIIGSYTGRPLRIEVIPADENDANIAAIHVARDLTEERAVRSQLVSSDRLAAIGRLAAGVAHEINNPAAFVTVNLGVLRDRFLAGNARTQDVLAMLEESLNGMDRIREIVRDLKGLARDRAIEVVDLGTTAQSAIRMAAHETRGRARVERVADDGATARVRGARIAQVVLNLVLNAAQALPVGRAENRIVVRTRREGDRARIEVADNGSGIDPAIAARVFEPFFTTRERSGGTGLGLWLARGIVEEEGGTLTFHDEPGGGVCFVIDLPAAPTEGQDSTRDVARPRA